MKSSKTGFRSGQHVVHPSHGVGLITAIETDVVAGFELELLVISFDKEKLVSRVPVAKAASSGVRPLSTAAEVDEALAIVGGRPKPSRTVWVRRAQELESRINTGSLKAAAEVVRDLARTPSDGAASSSERRIYEMAHDRVVKECAHVRGITETEAADALRAIIGEAPRRAA